MASVYFVFAHPHRNRSRANATILERVKDLTRVTVNDLYESYPDFNIDIEREKNAILSHDVIFLQHPLYWYSLPPLLKLWFDDVFELGLAYGPGGDAFKGKTLQSSITAGGPPEAYKDGGFNRFEVSQFLRPVEQTAHLCGMKWPEPLILFSTDRTSRNGIEAHAETVRDLVLSYSNPEYHPHAVGTESERP